MRKQSGFTVIELLVVIVLLIASTLLIWQQKTSMEQTARDRDRKTAINAMYYALEEVYYKQKSAYPATLNKDLLPWIDPAFFKDPQGTALGADGSNYRYDPINCEGDLCKSYTLRADLEKEADFVRQSRH